MAASSEALPPAKRARTDDEPDAEEKPPLWETAPSEYVKGQEVVRLRMVSAAGAEGASAPFAPEFVHQIFDGEALALPEAERPLTIEVLYAEDSLALFAKCDRPMTGAVEPIMYKLAEELPAMSASEAALVAEPAHKFDAAALGEVLTTYSGRASLPSSAADGDGSGGSGAAAAPATAAPVATCDYEIRLGTLHDSEARTAYNAQIQSLFRWFIENHSPIDTSDERWRLLTLFEVPLSPPPPSPTQPSTHLHPFHTPHMAA
jgi:hypothetical protein